MLEKKNKTVICSEERRACYKRAAEKKSEHSRPSQPQRNQGFFMTIVLNFTETSKRSLNLAPGADVNNAPHHETTSLLVQKEKT